MATPEDQPRREPRLWLCHAFGEDAVVREDAARLLHLGFRWRLRGAAGSAAIALERSRRCEVLVFFASAAALRCADCAAELAAALGDTRPVVVVELETVAWPPALRQRLGAATVLRRHDSPGDGYGRALFAAATAAVAAAPPLPVRPLATVPASERGALFGGVATAIAVLGLAAVTADLLAVDPARVPLPSQLEPGAEYGLGLADVRRGRPREAAPPDAGLRFLGGLFPEQRIDLDLRDAPLEDALAGIAEQVGMKLVTFGSLAGRVDAQVAAAPWDDVLDGLARRHALAVQVIEESIYVTSLRLEDDPGR